MTGYDKNKDGKISKKINVKKAWSLFPSFDNNTINFSIKF